MEAPSPVLRRAANPCPDVSEFLAVIRGERKPGRVHFAELFADQEVMQAITEGVLGKRWVPGSRDLIYRGPEREQMERHYLCQIEYWYRMGYDYIRVGGGVDFASRERMSAADTAPLSRGERGWVNAAIALITSWEDFERYPWPEVRDRDLWHYEFVAKHLPDGMGILACPHFGLLEMLCDCLIGYEPLCYLLADQPDLVAAVARRAGDILYEVYRRLVQYPRVVGFFQGDDMGFRSGTMVSPDFLRSHIFPWHQRVAELAHEHGKVYFLHSCGRLDAIMEDIIEGVRADAKHSFEDAIEPVESFAMRYGRRIGVLGGVDVDLLARAPEGVVRRRTREILEVCIPLGRYALGSGNSVTNYVRVENFLAMLEEGLTFSAAMRP